jgi:hypothetical protein
VQESSGFFYGRKMTLRVVELPGVTLRNVRSLPSRGASNASTWRRTIAMLMLLIIGNMQVRGWGGMCTWFYFDAGFFYVI